MPRQIRLSQAVIESLLNATHREPRSVLGYHEYPRANDTTACVVRVIEPDAVAVSVHWDDAPVGAASACRRLHDGGLFEGRLPFRRPIVPYTLRVTYRDGTVVSRHDPYYFAPRLSDYDLYLFGEGKHHRIYDKLGAHLTEVDGLTGTLFAVWAPGAARVSVVGDFNLWDGRRHAMQSRGSSGVWELFVPGVAEGALYKYEIRTPDGRLLLKADPYGYAMQLRPGNCSIVANLAGHDWNDAEWVAARATADPATQPINIYEVHPASWRRPGDRHPPFLTWSELADQLIPYVLDLGYTHIELMGVAEHPFDGSWGYQVVGYYAPTARLGAPRDFMAFVDRCHQAGIGVLMDWVPAHFPKDDHGLAEFDGSALYEHADPRQGEHRDWGTKIFNYGRHEVRNFLVANALFWLEHYHLDGVRVDAVASMLYLDYSREPGQWIPNRHGGRENLEAIEFLRELNWALQRYHPGVLSIAEESTAFPGVTQPSHVGGLGFTMKWNMGWMNDTLRYLHEDPIHRRYHHHLITFAFVYAWSERFLLPLSHDEVVHGKGSLLAKMPGDDWQKRANYRLLLAYQLMHPGKKLLFMGSEFGQWQEWQEQGSIDWHLLEDQRHRQLHEFNRCLNRLYREQRALHATDWDHAAFRWTELYNAHESVFGFERGPSPGADDTIIALFNATPVPREHYRIGVGSSGDYVKLFDSDEARFGGAGFLQAGRFTATAGDWNGRPASLVVSLPPLGAVLLQRARD